MLGEAVGGTLISPPFEPEATVHTFPVHATLLRISSDQPPCCPDTCYKRDPFISNEFRSELKKCYPSIDALANIIHTDTDSKNHDKLSLED